MPLKAKTYGKARVRVMRVERGGERHEVRELTVKAMLQGDIGATFTAKDNSRTVSTDTIKNVINVVAGENIALPTEPFCQAVAKKLLDNYPQMDGAIISAHETKWARLSFNGTPHPHSFVLDNNGRPFAEVTATRKDSTVVSGIDGITFMKTTESGWAGYMKDAYTTLPETRDRIAATSMVSSWLWAKAPADYPAANRAIIDTMIEVFATTYSDSIQDSLYRMGEAALAAMPEIKEIRLACPNKHYIPIDLARFKLDTNNQVFLPTDEPHGQIECVVAR